MEKMKGFIRKNQKALLQMAVMATAVALPEICSASSTGEITGIKSDMPWNTALQSLATEVTGPLPKLFGILAIGVGGGMLAFGELGPAARKVMQVVFGIGAAIGAVFLTNLVTSSAGLTF